MADEISFAATESGAKGWQKVLKRKPKQSMASATDVGWLRPGDSRVNMVGKLDAADKTNHYKFKVLSEGKFVVTSRADHDIRIQVVDANQRVVADSKPGMGQASQNFEKMTKDELTLKAGTYYLKVSRADTTPSDASVNMAVQMLVGDGGYKNDYITREVSPTKQERIAAATTVDLPTAASSSVTFLSDFAGPTSGGLMNPPVLGKILSVLA